MRLLGIVVALVVLAGCQNAASEGAACARDGECGALVCRLGRCRAECAETRDCPLGAECLPGASGGSCALATDRCTADAECPAPLVCGSDGQCRAACLSDADCTSDGHCVLAGRLVCVAGTTPPPTACPVGTNAFFADGLTGWCVARSSDLPEGAIRPEGRGDAATIHFDLSNAPVGAWARIYQEGPLVGADTVTFQRTSADVAGGTTLVAVELVDAHGTLLGRVGRAVVGSGTTDCEEAGVPTSFCAVEAFSPDIAMVPARASGTGYANVDLRRVTRVRRVIEIARTGTGNVDMVLDGVGTFTPACVYGWWRGASHIASFDLDDAASPPTGFSTSDAPVRTFPDAECGQALATDGTPTIDWVGALPPVYTVSFAWQAAMHLSPLDGLSLVHELGSDVDVRVEAGAIVAHGCGVVVRDPRAIGPDDARFQELSLLVDRTRGRLCLARHGHRIGCTDAPACAGTTATATGLRFGESTRAIGDTFALDELRVDVGADAFPGERGAASGHCTMDRTCFEYGSLEARDVGSNTCVPTSACMDLWLCPEAAAALDGTMCVGATPTATCTPDAACPAGLRLCGGACVPDPRACRQPFVLTCP